MSFTPRPRGNSMSSTFRRLESLSRCEFSNVPLKNSRPNEAAVEHTWAPQYSFQEIVSHCAVLANAF
jgi:hypothetical protein